MLFENNLINGYSDPTRKPDTNMQEINGFGTLGQILLGSCPYRVDLLRTR